MLMSRRQGFNVLKFEATYLYHVWNSRSWPLAVNTLLQHNSIAYVEWSAQLGQNAKTRQKIRSVKLTEHTCHCNDLTNFQYQVRSMTGNGNQVNLQELEKIREITSSDLIFGAF